MKIAVPKETSPSERRIALVPQGCKTLVNKGLTVSIESKAGENAGFSDENYTQAGASIETSRRALFSSADCVLMVSGPSDDDSEHDLLANLKEGCVWISFIFPMSNPKTVKRLAEKRITAFAMDLVPRISRAQSMDALSSMSAVAGYKAALIAANSVQKFLPMMMTAAGTLPPAHVFVIGAGVAGLQAIATCKRLGATVEAFDVRPAVKEQVESLGARFVGLGLTADELEDASGYAKEVSADTYAKELELIASKLPRCDIVITTALIPGKPAPVLLTKEMVKLMPKGSVIVDIAAPNGGNCELSTPGEVTQHDGITIVAPLNLPSEMATHSSIMYSKNITEFLLHLVRDGQFYFDMEDEITRSTMVTFEGKIMHEPTRLAMERGITL
ncbi:MAG TPA: Re/Si-specific NAD(P)(+) transhydrogenase subunit alpha [Fimbriimonadales bacterium]|nr:Re/Si-specific NAD(P)(+) transhydrogenase subunit alpha [Fimbriimonadales bacterium]